jgi:hypothetical protein
VSFTYCVWPHTTRDMITVNCMWPPSVQNHLKYLFKKITDENTLNSEKSIIKMSLYKRCGWWKNFDCIFGFSVKSYVRNTINISCAKILLSSVISICRICKTLMIAVLSLCSSHSCYYLWLVMTRLEKNRRWGYTCICRRCSLDLRRNCMWCACLIEPEPFRSPQGMSLIW